MCDVTVHTSINLSITLFQHIPMPSSSAKRNLFGSKDDSKPKAHKKPTVTKQEVRAIVERSIDRHSETKQAGIEFAIDNHDGTTDSSSGASLFRISRGTNMYHRVGRQIETSGIRVQYHLSGHSSYDYLQLKIAVLELKGSPVGTFNAVDYCKKELLQSLNNAHPVPTWAAGVSQAEKLTMELNTAAFKVHDIRTFNLGGKTGIEGYPVKRVGYYNVPIKKKITYSDNSALGLGPSDSELSSNFVILCWGGTPNILQPNNTFAIYDALIQVKMRYKDM